MVSLLPTVYSNFVQTSYTSFVEGPNARGSFICLRTHW